MKWSVSLLEIDQVCLLNTRLAATENMTHDIIRDLLGVKLDMTNYAVSFRYTSAKHTITYSSFV